MQFLPSYCHLGGCLYCRALPHSFWNELLREGEERRKERGLSKTLFLNYHVEELLTIFSLLLKKMLLGTSWSLNYFCVYSSSWLKIPWIEISCFYDLFHELENPDNDDLLSRRRRPDDHRQLQHLKHCYKVAFGTSDINQMCFTFVSLLFKHRHRGV